VGTGAIQVTLTWFSAQSIDLDLWVTDPSGEMCFWLNPTTSSGGVLDRDNHCLNYINGHPENIFWQNAINGLYIVEVSWYSDCDNGMTSQSYTVRTVVQGVVRTFEGTITNEDEYIEVTRFEVQGPTVAFLPGRGTVEKSGISLPPKY
jgi:uncharacterized protein YfaP (DUF2135 family)